MEKYGSKARERFKERYKAIVFFMRFALAECDHIAIENPVGIMSTAYKKPTQTIQPWMFGDAAEKKTNLWLKNLPTLVATGNVSPQKRVEYETGKSIPKWYADAWHLPKEERAKLRSKTFPGIAAAMAKQWGDYIESQNKS